MTSGGPHFAAFCRATSARRRDAGPAAPRPRAVAARVLVGGPRARPATGLRVYSEVGLGIPRKNTSRRWPLPPASTSSSPTARPSPRSTSPLPPEARPGSSSARPARWPPRAPAHGRARRPGAPDQAPQVGGIMRALSADAALQHGLNPSANIVDELHAHKNADLYTALTTGTGAREQPFTLWIRPPAWPARASSPTLPADVRRRPASSRTAARCGSTATAATASSSTGTAPLATPTSRTPPSGSAATRSATSRTASTWTSSTAASRAAARCSSGGCTTSTSSPRARRPGCRPAHGLPAATLAVSARPFAPFRSAWRSTAPRASDLAAVVVAQRQGERCVVRSRVFAPDPSPARQRDRDPGLPPRAARAVPGADGERSGRTARMPGPAFAYDPVELRRIGRDPRGRGLHMLRFAQTDQLLAPATGLTADLVIEREARPRRRPGPRRARRQLARQGRRARHPDHEAAPRVGAQEPSRGRDGHGRRRRHGRAARAGASRG
jgi:hypothetical protein